MSRRDTIIIAVLVNAGLLMVLFATAVRSDDKKTASKAKEIVEAKVSKPSSSLKRKDDDPINHYVTAQAPLETHEELFLDDEFSLDLLPEEPKVVASSSAPPSSSKEEHFVDVTVKKGDVLEKIARANHTTVAAIMKSNNMASTTLKVGQVLRVPVQKTGEQPHQEKAVSHEGEYYIVKEGDNPWLIATKNHLRLDELLRLNNLDDSKARRLRPGDRLKIR